MIVIGCGNGYTHETALKPFPPRGDLRARKEWLGTTSLYTLFAKCLTMATVTTTATMTKTTTKETPTLRLGTIVNLLIIASTVVYLLVVVGHAFGGLNIFGTNWAADGFCLSFKGTLAHSHLLCFYTDTAWALLFYFIDTQGRSELQIVKDSSFSVLMHGMGHGMIWCFGELENTSSPLVMQRSTTESAILILGGYLFYYSFFRSTFSFSATVIQAVLHAVVTVVAIPPLYLFTYVNTVLTFVLLGKQLTSEKDKFYDRIAWGVSLPINIVAWMEPLTCDDFLINLGGHLWFDFSIPTCTFLYYLWAKGQEPRAKKAQ